METEIGRVENKLDMKLFETETRLTNLIQNSMRDIQDIIRQGGHKKRKRKDKKRKERDSDEGDDEH